MALDYFVTLLLARLDPGRRSVVYCNAGHWPGYVLGPDGEVRATLPSTNIPLGLLMTSEFPSQPAIPLQPGERVFLFTDGLIEAQSGGRGLLWSPPSAEGAPGTSRRHTPGADSSAGGGLG